MTEKYGEPRGKVANLQGLLGQGLNEDRSGGFTDVMLQNGAKKVYAVDVGYGQLDVKLRNDPRVVNREKVNARYLQADAVAGS